VSQEKKQASKQPSILTVFKNSNLLRYLGIRRLNMNQSALTVKSISISQMEQAINYWRKAQPSTQGDMTLCKEASLLADTYAIMIFNKNHEVPESSLCGLAQTAFNQAQQEMKAPIQNAA
jgi:hypothetical protein